MPLLRDVGRLLYGAGMTDERKDFVSLKKNKVDSENWQIKNLYTSHTINKIRAPFEKKKMQYFLNFQVLFSNEH